MDDLGVPLFSETSICDILVESCATHKALLQVAGSVAVAVVITDPSLAVSLSWADLISVGLLSY